MYSIIITGLFSCAKPQQGSSLNPQFKQYFDYKKGSYWVFYDSTNHYMDSLYLIDYNDYPVNYDNSFSNEELNLGLWEFDYDTNAYCRNWGMFIWGPNSASLSISYQDTIVNYTIADEMPFQKGILSNKNGSIYCITTLLINYIVENKLYDSVYQVIYPNNNYSDTIYFNHGYGFLEFLFNDQNSQRKLYLLRCNVIR